MFLPPERRDPGSAPWDAPPPRRARSRGETIVIGLACLLLLSIVMAPMGGSSLIEAIWYLARH